MLVGGDNMNIKTFVSAAAVAFAMSIGPSSAAEQSEFSLLSGLPAQPMTTGDLAATRGALVILTTSKSAGIYVQRASIDAPCNAPHCVAGTFSTTFGDVTTSGALILPPHAP